MVRFFLASVLLSSFHSLEYEVRFPRFLYQGVDLPLRRRWSLTVSLLWVEGQLTFETSLFDKNFLQELVILGKFLHFSALGNSPRRKTFFLGAFSVASKYFFS